MERRLDYSKVAPEGLKALRGLQAYVDNCGLEHSLLEIVKAKSFTNQRMRLLPRHAYQGCASRRRVSYVFRLPVRQAACPQPVARCQPHCQCFQSGGSNRSCCRSFNNSGCGFARRVTSGKLVLESLKQQTDAEVRDHLMMCRGPGQATFPTSPVNWLKRR